MVNQTQLPDGRRMVTWEMDHPKLYELRVAPDLVISTLFSLDSLPYLCDNVCINLGKT